MSTTTTVIMPKTLILPNTISTEKESLKFMKKTMAIAVSTIAYLRFDLPEEAFLHMEIENLKFVLLSSKSTCPTAIGIMERLKAALDALGKGYLKDLLLYVYRDQDNSTKVHEMYKFTFMPTGLSIERSGNSSVVVGKSQVEANEVISETAFQQQVKQLLRRLIILTQNLGSLPEKPFLGVKTSYHLHTPADYQPPGFMPASPVMSLTFGLKTVNDKLGKVSTRFHTLKGEVTSPDFEESPEPVQPQLSAVDHRQVSSQASNISHPFIPILNCADQPKTSVPRQGPSQSPETGMRRRRGAGAGYGDAPARDTTFLKLAPQVFERMDEFVCAKKIKV